MVGRLGPYKSASKMPTLKPSSLKEKARLTDTVDFPTPPLQEDTAITFLTSSRPLIRTEVWASVWTAYGAIVTLIELAHGSDSTN